MINAAAAAGLFAESDLASRYPDESDRKIAAVLSWRTDYMAYLDAIRGAAVRHKIPLLQMERALFLIGRDVGFARRGERNWRDYRRVLEARLRRGPRQAADARK